MTDRINIDCSPEAISKASEELIKRAKDKNMKVVGFRLIGLIEIDDNQDN